MVIIPFSSPDNNTLVPLYDTLLHSYYLGFNLQYHTPIQVLVGMLVGVVAGTMWFAIVNGTRITPGLGFQSSMGFLELVKSSRT